MAQNRNKQIRDLRQRSKGKLVRVNDQLNSLTWDIFELNTALKDVNITRAVAVLDDALSLIQRAGALLNSVHVEPDAPTPTTPEKSGFQGTADKESGRQKANMSRSVSSVN